MPNNSARCDDCATFAECRFAFGDFWTCKSGGGRGCAHPFRPPWSVADINRRMGSAKQARTADLFEKPWERLKKASASTTTTTNTTKAKAKPATKH